MQGKLAKGDARDSKLLVVGVGTPGDLAAAVETRGTRVARQLGELLLGLELLFDRDLRIVQSLAQLGTLFGVLGDHALPLAFAGDEGFTGHYWLLF